MGKIIENEYAYCDLQIVPAVTTSIESRSECNPYYRGFKGTDNQYLPIFTAPMDSVCDDKNLLVFENANVIPVIHRNVPLEDRLHLVSRIYNLKWVAFSLNEFEKYFCNRENFPTLSSLSKESVYRICIDCANGHMERIFTLAKKAQDVVKSINADNKNSTIILELMAGNIANPETYYEYCKAGIDYVRCSIGTGSMCLTTANTAIGYPAASLIKRIAEIKNSVIKSEELQKSSEYFKVTKIIADGGIRNYSDVVIALACGADFVMIGGMFAGCFDSCASFVKSYPDYEFGPRNGCNEDIKFHIFSHYINSEDINKVREELEELKKDSCYSLRYNINVEGETALVELFLSPENIYEPKIAEYILKHARYLRKKSHGMSSKEAQIAGLKVRDEYDDNNYKSKLKTSEGKTIEQYVQYTVAKLTENIASYLRSAMSYTNKTDIKDFIGQVDLVVKSYGTAISVNK